MVYQPLCERNGNQVVSCRTSHLAFLATPFSLCLSLDSMDLGFQDGSLGRHTCCKAGWPEFNSEMLKLTWKKKFLQAVVCPTSQFLHACSHRNKCNKNHTTTRVLLMKILIKNQKIKTHQNPKQIKQTNKKATTKDVMLPCLAQKNLHVTWVSF